MRALRESLPFIVSGLLVMDILLRADLLSSPRDYVATSTVNGIHLHSNSTFRPLEKPQEMQGNLTSCPKCNATISFKDFLSKSDFEQLENWTKDDLEKWFKGVQEFQVQEPLVPVNVSCEPRPLPLYNDTTCEKKAFPGGKNPPVKVGHAIQFGFDVDTLEIHLNEIYEVVDKIFITEMTITHNQFFPTKQLIWDRVKNQDRFRKFRDKIIHFVLDDLDIARMRNDGGSSIWVGEGYQESKRWQKIQEWNEYTRFFGADDVIGFGDTDEIASRENIHQIKHCQFHTNSIDVGIWFSFGRIDQAFASDFPVSGHKYTLGDPSFWRYASAQQKKGKVPSRMRGKSGNFLLGGMHMTHYGYLPYQLIKTSSATEATPAEERLRSLVSQVAVAFHQNKLLELDEKMSQSTNRRIKKLNSLNPSDITGIVYLPWFYDCNRDRYPRWEGKPDSRMGF